MVCDPWQIRVSNSMYESKNAVILLPCSSGYYLSHFRDAQGSPGMHPKWFLLKEPWCSE